MREAKPLYKPGMLVNVDGVLEKGVIEEVRQRADGVSYVVVAKSRMAGGTFPQDEVRLAWMPREPNRAAVDDDSIERSALGLMGSGGSSSSSGDAVVYVHRTEHEDLFKVEVYRFEKWTLMAKPTAARR